MGIRPDGDVGHSNAGFTGGYMGLVPDNTNLGGTNWIDILGGPVLTGKGAIAVSGSSSWGPSIWTFDPESMIENDPAPANYLTGYMNDGVLGAYQPFTYSTYYNESTDVNGIVFPYGSKSVLIFGKNGTGPNCYGAGTETESLAYTFDPDKGDGTYANVYSYATNSILTVRNGIQTVEIPDIPFDPIGFPIIMRSNSGALKVIRGVVTGYANPVLTFDANTQNNGGTGSGSDWNVSLSDSGAVNVYCYNPTWITKGNQATPDIYQIWAYNADDLAAVKSGNYHVTSEDYAAGRFIAGWNMDNTHTILPVGSLVTAINIKPYALWSLEDSILAKPKKEDLSGRRRILGAGYDQANQLVYLATEVADDTEDYDYYPLIQVFKINLPLQSMDVTAPASPTGLSVE